MRVFSRNIGILLFLVVFHTALYSVVNFAWGDWLGKRTATLVTVALAPFGFASYFDEIEGGARLRLKGKCQNLKVTHQNNGVAGVILFLFVVNTSFALRFLRWQGSASCALFLLGALATFSLNAIRLALCLSAVVALSGAKDSIFATAFVHELLADYSGIAVYLIAGTLVFLFAWLRDLQGHKMVTRS